MSFYKTCENLNCENGENGQPAKFLVGWEPEIRVDPKKKFCCLSCSSQRTRNRRKTCAEIRFWSKIDKNGTIHPYKPELGNCWNWNVSLNNGYGRFLGDNGNLLYAHRFSYILHNPPKDDDPPITDDIFICHSCDNRFCTNPEHLFIGDAQINSNDMVSKDRQAQGDSVLQKLTEELVLEIDKKYATGEYTQQQLSEEYNVSQRHLNAILTYKKWKNRAKISKN